MRLIPLLLLCAALSPALAADLPRLSAEDIFALEYAEQPRVSPDGATVVYRRRSNDIMTDRTASNLWLLDVASGAHRPLVSGAGQASSPRWSPDGGRIAWVQDLEEGKALQVRWLATGQTAQVARLPHPPRHLAWSPDGRWLAFVMLVPETREALVKAPKKPEGAEWAAPVQVIDSPIYRWDGRGFLEPYGDQIFVVPADGGSPRQLTEGEFRHRGPLAWTPDGSELLFSANRDPDWAFQPGERDLWSVRVADGELTRLTDRPGGSRRRPCRRTGAASPTCTTTTPRRRTGPGCSRCSIVITAATRH